MASVDEIRAYWEADAATYDRSSSHHFQTGSSWLPARSPVGSAASC